MPGPAIKGAGAASKGGTGATMLEATLEYRKRLRRAEVETNKVFREELKKLKETSPDKAKPRAYTQATEIILTLILGQTLAELGLLAARVAELEARPAQTLDYKGLWHAGRYPAGAFVTLGGSLWRAKAETQDKPGTSAAWNVVVERGKAGRPGKGATR